MVALAVLTPIVASSMGGNAGTQTMTVAVRALATRDLSDANARRVIAARTAGRTAQRPRLRRHHGRGRPCVVRCHRSRHRDRACDDLHLTAAALGGILIPLALTKLGVDPAVSSGPFVTTVTDVVGFFSFLGIATLWFGLK